MQIWRTSPKLGVAAVAAQTIFLTTTLCAIGATMTEHHKFAQGGVAKLTPNSRKPFDLHAFQVFSHPVLRKPRSHP
jgi:hypothetical protein